MPTSLVVGEVTTTNPEEVMSNYIPSNSRCMTNVPGVDTYLSGDSWCILGIVSIGVTNV